MAHEHREAFMLMTYAADDGREREVLWNSRDGVTPFVITSREGNEMTHVDWQRDGYAPLHVPKVGDRIFVDLTPQRAVVLAATVVESNARDEDTRLQMEAQFATREECVANYAQRLLVQGGGGRPPTDILVVTAGFLQDLEEQRREPPDRVVFGYDMAAVVDLERQEDSFYFDRQCKPIDHYEYVRLFSLKDYQVLANTVVSSTHWVSTVWLGTNHRYFGPGAPLIFETMVFRGQLGDTREGVEQDRWSTEAEAFAGHEAIVARYRARATGSDN